MVGLVKASKSIQIVQTKNVLSIKHLLLFSAIIYLINKTVKIVRLSNIITLPKNSFLILNCRLIYCCDQTGFSAHYSSIQSHMIFRNHTNMLI